MVCGGHTSFFSAGDRTHSLVYAGQILSTSEPPLKSHFLCNWESFLVTVGTLSPEKLV